jgi:hypothetical protein
MMNFITIRHFFLCLFTFSFLINFAQSRAKFTDKFKVVSGGYYHNVLENYGLNGFYDPEPIYFNDKDTGFCVGNQVHDSIIINSITYHSPTRYVVLTMYK